MKVNDLLDFIMENISDEEWKNFYMMGTTDRHKMFDRGIKNKNPYGYVYSRIKDSKQCVLFNENVRGEAWRKQFIELFYGLDSSNEYTMLYLENELKEKIIYFLMTEYMCALINYYTFDASIESIGSELYCQIPENRRSYKGKRRNMAVYPEYWVFSRYDVDEDLGDTVEKDNRFTDGDERKLTYDITASIKDFMKNNRLVGIKKVGKAA